MKHIIKLISKLFGKRAEIKAECANTEDQGIFNILHNDYEWRKTRNEHIEKYPLCAICGELKDLEVHHIVPWHLSVDGRYDKNNLITLCRYHHFRFGHWRDWKGSNPDILKMALYITTMRP